MKPTSFLTGRGAIVISLLVILALALVLLATLNFRPAPGQVATPAAEQVAEPVATPTPGPRTVFVHLFEWRWPDVAQECESFLGPKGYSAVQVSPPQEHIVADNNPWWERYQPVSYRLESRSGTRAEFADMVSRCKAVGVDVYADAVINHMSGMDGGTGIAGSSFTHYNYPGLYEEQDFHHCGLTGKSDDIFNYRDRVEVQTCELVNLADLDTGSSKVQDRIATYLNDMVGLGVAGFRIDAAKHVDAKELGTILGKLNGKTSGGKPYIYQEVIEASGEPIRASEYFTNGDVSEFKYSTRIGPNFRYGQLPGLEEFAMSGSFIPSDLAIVFTDNHDNQRGHGAGGDVLTFKDGPLYNLANVYMLGWPYGYPQVMSSYNFDNSDQGPPAHPDGSTMPVYSNGVPDCGDETWVCEHRRQEIAGLVGFRNYTAPRFEVTNWWTNGDNAIAFGRGDLGYVIINRQETEVKNTFQTGMPAGNYCDVTKGELSPDGNGCTGPSIMVDEKGQVMLTVPPMSAIAIHGGAKVGGR
ncbi:MAG TPA: alpha-amylase family protein [Chloroflexia bacterium]|nr:alpha-amylase family protein [Chloroflexia bacterium]